MKINRIDETLIKDFEVIQQEMQTILKYKTNAKAVYGLGERFDGVNRLNKTTTNIVFEHFTMQDTHTYLPIPFYFCDNGHGLFIDTDKFISFNLNSDCFEITIDETDCSLHFLYGKPQEIIRQFVDMTGEIFLPPSWAFGPWISANRWNCQQDIEEQLQILDKTNYPATVMVIEAWSDEATFYIWNGAQYNNIEGNNYFNENDFTFAKPWPDPKGMIQKLHEQGIRLILWQIPALKKLEEHEHCPQHLLDKKYATENNLVVKNIDDSPHEIPRQWFVGSYIPDFTNPQTCKWWMDKRQYLLDMGVDGFKTDGGEFIHETNIKFANGETGITLRNRYCAEYEKAYYNALDCDKVIFSRAGYIGAQKTPIHWAGDQLSTFAELRSVLSAGLSLSLSGIPMWGFDIAGFAGKLPTCELYVRATQLATFSPIMQWHSEPAGGQYGEDSEPNAVNDRSPWNMANRTKNIAVEKISIFYANLRMNLLPEIYNCARICAIDKTPLMRHLVVDYPDDIVAISVFDEFMLGDLLVAPITTFPENSTFREVYLPKGKWYSFLDKKYLDGNCKLEVSAQYHQIPVFMRCPGAVCLNLSSSLLLGDYVGNQTSDFKSLTIVMTGNANYDFQDESKNCIDIKQGKILKSDMETTIISPEDVNFLTFFDSEIVSL